MATVAAVPRRYGDGVAQRFERSWSRAVAAVLVRPWLWCTALRIAGRSSPRGWWHRSPFVPRPPAAFVAFRLETQYGSTPGSAPVAEDLVAYLAWCRSLDRDRSRDRGRKGAGRHGPRR